MTLKDIDKTCKYEGYIWMSDASEPIVLNKELISIDLEKNNPFIIEAMLINENKDLSYSIRYIDGMHHIKEYNIDDNELLGNERFIAKRIKDHTKLRFFQRWKEEPDPLCEGMETKVPAELIFVGFETSKTEEV